MNATRELELMDRIVLGDASDDDWAHWTSYAETRPGAWRQLALAQRDQALLQDLMQQHAHVADEVDLQYDDASDPALPLVHVARSARRATRATDDLRGEHTTPSRAWSGLAVAALVLLVLTITQFRMSNPESGRAGLSNTANAGLLTSSADAFNAYLERGREEGVVVNEVPTRLLLDTKPDPNGNGYQVLYVRQIIEKINVPELYYNNGVNEIGEPMLLQYSENGQRSY